VTAEAWVDLEAGASLPGKNYVDETWVFHRHPPEFVAACGFAGRVESARRAGYTGPVLYLKFDTPTAFSYSPDGFDPEHDYEGPPDLSGGTLEQTLVNGRDRVEVWALPPGR